MYAVFESGGKQHRVKEGDILKLEKIEAATGDAIAFDRVLLMGQGAEVQLGQPLIEGASVSAEVLAQGRHDKIHIVKFKRRKHHMKRTGHRQWYTEVKVTGISA